VFGPLITSARRSPSSRSIGTALFWSSSRDDGATPASREAATGESEVEACGRRDQVDKGACLCSDERGEIPQDPRHLVAFCNLGLAQSVRVVDSRERFDEERLPRAGRVVDDAGDASSRRRAQRKNRTAPALCHEVVLQVLGERWIAGDLAEALGELAAPLPEHAAQAAELGRGRVTQVGSVLFDRTADLLRARE
jgi:hypothetical protein